MFQQSATVNTEELLVFENEKLKATIEDLKKCVDPADAIKYPIAGENLFVLQENSSHFLNWEEYGIRINIQQGSIPLLETCEIGFRFSLEVSSVFLRVMRWSVESMLSLFLQHFSNHWS